MENQGDGNFLRAIEVVLGWIESLKLVPVGCMRGERIKVGLIFKSIFIAFPDAFHLCCTLIFAI